jgi:hypothetical protein
MWTLTRIAQGTLRMIDNTIDRLGAKRTRGQENWKIDVPERFMLI